MKRREFFIRSGSTMLGSSLLLNCNDGLAQKTEPVKIYLQKCLEILRKIQNQELPKLAYIAERAAEIYKLNGKVYSRIQWGNLREDDLMFSQKGNPGYLAQISRIDQLSIIESLQKGDFYVTNGFNLAVQEAKKRGVYVVGISHPASSSKLTLADQIISSDRRLTIEDASNLVLYSNVPIEDGILAFPEYPMVPLCPGSSIPPILYYWMLTAEITYHLKSEKTYPFISKARDYIEIIIMRMYELEKQIELIKEVASRMAANIKSKGALFIYDKSRNLISEACNRASGLMLTRPLEIDNVKPNDCVIVGSENAADPEDISLIRQLIQKKALVISISPFAENVKKKSSIREEAHLALDNLAGEVDCVVTILKEEPPICPTSGIMNIILLWALTSQFIGEMKNLGLIPYAIMGEHLPGGAEYNAAIRRFFEKRGF